MISLQQTQNSAPAHAGQWRIAYTGREGTNAAGFSIWRTDIAYSVLKPGETHIAETGHYDVEALLNQSGLSLVNFD